MEAITSLFALTIGESATNKRSEILANTIRYPKR
jgi:hypothetical protein